LLSGTLFLHGGNEFHADSAEFDQHFVNVISGAKVGIFPGASVSERDRIATVAFASGYFSLYGIELEELKDLSASALAPIDALILPGGSPLHLLEKSLPHRDALDEFLDRGVIYGASAGAMVLGRGFTMAGAWHSGLAFGQFEALVHFAGELPARPGLLYGLPEGGGLAVARTGEILAKSSGVEIRA
jgi:hypothetical protein